MPMLDWPAERTPEWKRGAAAIVRALSAGWHANLLWRVPVLKCCS